MPAHDQRRDYYGNRNSLYLNSLARARDEGSDRGIATRILNSIILAFLAAIKLFSSTR